jgi:hypothetical protein
MTFALTSPITGQAQTGFTAPTYTHVSDQAPDISGKQVAVTALGGTQVGVTTHSMSSPFTFTFFRPKVFRFLGKPNPTTGLIKDVPRNTFKGITRKGVTVLVGQPFQNMQITTIIDLPAGADTADAPNVRAALSLHFGALVQQSSGIGDTSVTGIV